MRMVTIPNQSSVPKAWQEFDDQGRMKPSPYYDRVVDVMEELFKFTLMVRDRSEYLVSRYSERKGAAQAKAISAASGILEATPPSMPASQAEPRPRKRQRAAALRGACAHDRGDQRGVDDLPRPGMRE
jgi:arsenic resistance protein ArsH